MHIHILGICGTFMGSLAVIAQQLGHRVSGSDKNVYPPMSTQLEELGIELMEGYLPEHLQPKPDLVLIGNALSRGNLAVETVLNAGIAYTSGPQWLSQAVLQHKWVLGVAGTHGKTTTSVMLAWVLSLVFTWIIVEPSEVLVLVCMSKNSDRIAAIRNNLREIGLI